MLAPTLAHKIHQYCLRIWMEEEEEASHALDAHLVPAERYIEAIDAEEDLHDVSVQELADTVLRLGAVGVYHLDRHPTPERVIEELRRAHQINFIPD